MESMKHMISQLPGAETASKTVEVVEEKVKQVVSSIPVVGQSATVKNLMGIHDNSKQHETPSTMSHGLEEAGITPIEPSEEHPKTISERVKPVLSSMKEKLGMEEKQSPYIDKIIEHFKYFASEIKQTQNSRIYARAILKGRNNIVGDLTFGQDLSTGETCCVGSVVGLSKGEHAINIHEYGDLSQGHSSIGSHFKPYHSVKHGGPTDKERHLGDMGNITAGANGHAEVDFRNLDVALVGPFSIIGRAVEIHAKGDMESVPPCDCPSDCECRISSGTHCPRAHKCAMCSAMMKMGEPIAIGLIVHAAEMKHHKQINMNSYMKPWESLHGTSD